MSARKNKEKPYMFKSVTLAFGVLAALMTANHAASAGEFGVVAGGLDEFRNLGITYKTAPMWQGQFAGRPVDLGVEYSVGMFRANHGDGKHELAYVGATPFVSWWFAANTGAEVGIGANLFSATRLGDKEFATAFQFGSSLGVFHRLQGTPWLLGLRVTHYSNAGIKEPNPGQNYILLRASYALP